MDKKFGLEFPKTFPKIQDWIFFQTALKTPEPGYNPGEIQRKLIWTHKVENIENPNFKKPGSPEKVSGK